MLAVRQGGCGTFGVLNRLSEGVMGQARTIDAFRHFEAYKYKV